MKIRPFGKEDLHLLQSWLASTEIVGEYQSPSTISLSCISNSFEQNYWQGPYEYRWLCLDLEDNPIGYCSAWLCDGMQPHYEIGLTLLPSIRGKKLGNVFLKLLISNVFNYTQTHRIRSIIACKNYKALNCWLRVGFRIEGVLRAYMKINDTFEDSFILSVLCNEWSTI